MNPPRTLRRRLLALAPVLALALPGAAPRLAAQDLTVTGVVVDEAERPLAGVEVTLHAATSRLERGDLVLAGRVHPEPAARARTDARGRFRIAAPEPGLWTVVARLPGRVPMERALHPLLAPADLEPAVLLPDAGLAVQVLDGAGEPLGGVPVLLRGHGPSEPFRSWRPWSWQVPRRRAAVTGPGGRAVLPRLDGEAGVLYASGPRGGAFVEVPRGEAPSPVRVVPVPSPTRLLRALTPDRRPVPGAMVWVQGPIPAGTTAEDGTLAVPLPGGEPVEVHLDAAGGRVAHAVLAPPADGETGPVDVVLEPVPEVAGRVVRAGGGRGIAGAVVWSEDEPAAVVESGPGGAFRLPVLHGPGDAALLAVAPDFLGARVTVAEGPDAPVEAVVLELEPAGWLSGRVVDAEGRPLPWATVRASSASAPFSTRASLTEPGMARSGSDGRFRIDGLPRGEALTVRASLEGYAPWSERVVPATAEAEPLAPPFPEVDVVLRAGSTVRGWLVDETGAPVAGAEVVLVPDGARPEAWASEPEGTRRAETGPDGVFELTDLPAGRVHLSVSASGYAPLLRPGVEVPARPETVELGEIVLGPDAILEGVVEDARGAPVAGAEVQARPGDSSGYAGRFLGRRRSDRPMTTGGDGRFRFEGLRPGDTVSVQVTKEGFAPGMAAGIRLPAEEEVRIVLEPSAHVSGRVVDEAGREVPESDIVYSRRQGWGGTSFRPTDVKEEGRFLVEVPPGTIELHAAARGYQASAPVLLELEAGERREGVELVLRPAAIVRGRVLAPEGSPVPMAQVSITTFRERETSSRGESADAEGRFALEAAPGRVRLEARQDGYAPAVRDLELGPGGATVELRLGRGTEVRGTVVGPEGDPAPGRRVQLVSRDPFQGGSGQQLSAADGSFEFRGVEDGTYHLTVADEVRRTWPRAGFYRHPDEIVVEAGSTVDGILVRLPRRTTLRGRLLGVAADELARLIVMARGGDEGSRVHGGAVLDGGGYEVTGLGPGRWTVVATVEGSGKSGQGTVEIEPGQTETYLDLELREGLTVTGTVRWNGEPASGVRIEGTSRNLASGSRAVTGPDGRFRLSGLAPGRQELVLSAYGRGLWTSRTVEVDGGDDLLLEIETRRVRGTVLSAAGMEPLAGASVALEPRAEGVLRSTRPSATTADGTFLLEAVEPGAYRLRVEKPGYGAHVSSVEVAAGEAILPPVVLEPAEALELR